MQNKTDDPLERQGCPVCGSYDLECYREDHIDWYDAAGYVGGTQITAFFRCHECRETWWVDDPSDAAMYLDNLFPN